MVPTRISIASSVVTSTTALIGAGTNAFIDILRSAGRQAVVELVEMLAVRDSDIERAGQTCELAAARIGNDGDAQLRVATRHGAGVLKHEAPAAAIERASDALDGDITG